MNGTEQFCEHIARTDFSSIDEASVKRAKVRVLDSLGVIAAGAYGPACDTLLSLVSRWGGAAESTVFVHGVKAPAHNAAMMNSLMMRSYDFEAIEAEGETSSSPAHISGTTVPVAFAVAEWQKASGKEFLTALILGDDLASRLGAASGFDLYGGWDNTGTINCLGAAAIAGKLLGLDAGQMNDALGIALNQLGGTIDNINDKTLGFKLPMSFASRNAIASAELAQLGYKAAQDAIFGAHGFFGLYCPKPMPDGVLKGLGSRYYADCVVKPWSACRATHGTIDSCVQIVSENSFDPRDIASVHVHVTPATYGGFVGQPFEIGDEPQVSGAFSIRFTAANALMHGTVRPEHMTRESMEDPLLQEILGKIELVPSIDPALYLTTEVEVTLKDGRVLFARTQTAKGDINKRPMTENEIVEKYWANIAFSQAVSSAAGEEAIALVDRLEELEDVGELARTLTASAGV